MGATINIANTNHRTPHRVVLSSSLNASPGLLLSLREQQSAATDHEDRVASFFFLLLTIADISHSAMRTKLFGS